MTTESQSTGRQDRASDVASYIYEPLPTESAAIRLIQIRPDDTQIHGFSLTVQSFILKEAPAFCCLSYTWQSAKVPEPGSHENDEAAANITVKCGAQTITITENLFDFLSRARDEHWFTPKTIGRDSEDVLRLNSGQQMALPLYLWIDAISINQNDIPERSKQVSMMGDIYSLSQTVLVWLGKEEPPPGAKRTFCDFIPRFLHLLRSEGLSIFRDKDPFCNDPELVRLLGEGICARWRDDWTSFFLFLVQCRWFQRGWVVQEVILKSLESDDQVIILCGTLGVRWLDLSLFLARLTSLNWRPTLTKRLRSHGATKKWKYSFSEMMQCANSVFNVRTIVEGSFLGKTSSRIEAEFGDDMTTNERIYNIFFKFVNLLRTQDFSDKRDTIYGFVGLLSAILPPGTSSPVQVDYSLSDVDVLTNEVWRIVSNMSHLDVLSSVQSDSRGVGYPSWVPNFSRRFIGAHFQQIRRSYGQPQFDASMTKSPCSLYRLTEGRGLTLVGTRVVDIATRGIPVFTNEMEDTSLERLLEVALGKDKRHYSPMDQPQDEALCRTLVADTFPSILKEEDYRSAFREWWKSALARRIGLLDLRSKVEGSDGDINEQLSDLTTFFLQHGSNWDWIPSLDEVLDAADTFRAGNKLPTSPIEMVIHRLWSRRTFFHTTDGYFGLGPRGLTARDEVWLLKGGRTPFVLRQRAGGKDYQFIGEAYVHGLMYGEAATSAFDQKMGPVTIF